MGASAYGSKNNRVSTFMPLSKFYLPPGRLAMSACAPDLGYTAQMSAAAVTKLLNLNLNLVSLAGEGRLDHLT